MPVETWPDGLYPIGYRFYLQPHTLKPESPFTRKQRTIRLQGERWMYDMTLRPRNREMAQALEALLDRLKGPRGQVALWDMDREAPLGPNQDLSGIPRTQFSDLGSSGTGIGIQFWGPWSMGVAATVTTVQTQFTDGTRFSGGTAGIRVYGWWPLGAEQVLVSGFRTDTPQLKAGDNIGLSGRLYRITNDAAPDGAGRAYLYLNRPLMATVPHRTDVVRTRPTSPFSLIDDDQSARDREAGRLGSYNLRFQEAL